MQTGLNRGIASHYMIDKNGLLLQTGKICYILYIYEEIHSHWVIVILLTVSVT